MHEERGTAGDTDQVSPLQVAKLPFIINDGKWHHLCITWTTRDGVWEAFQDGVMRGNGENLAPYHPIKPDGVLVLGQEQVDICFFWTQSLTNYPFSFWSRIRGGYCVMRQWGLL